MTLVDILKCRDRCHGEHPLFMTNCNNNDDQVVKIIKTYFQDSVLKS